MMLTYQTKLKNVDNNLDDFLKGMCELYSKVELNLYRDIQKGIGTRGSLKKTYMFRYGITSRHYNAIVINLEGKIDSVKELQSMYIKEVKDKIKEVDKVVKSKELQKAKLFKTLDKAIKTNGLHTESTMKIVKRYKKLKFTIHQKKRKLRNLKHRLKRLESKLNSICNDFFLHLVSKSRIRCKYLVNIFIVVRVVKIDISKNRVVWVVS